MENISKETFVIFFSVDYSNSNEAERIVLLRNFVKKGFGTNITVLDEAVLYNSYANNFFIVASAENRLAITAATAHCAGIYHVNIIEVKQIQINQDITAANYCLFIHNNTTGTSEATVDAVPKPEEVLVRTSIELPPGSPCDTMLLLQSPSLGEADSYGHYYKPGAYILPLVARPAKDYFYQHYGTGDIADLAMPLTTEAWETALPARVVTVPASFELLNKGGDTYYSDMNTGLNLMSPKKVARKDVKVRVTGPAYLYWILLGEFTYNLNNSLIIPIRVLKKVTSHAPFPNTVVAGPQDAVMTFDLLKGPGVEEHTVLGDWLNELLNTKKYDAPWPEDTYTGELLDAYNYWLTLLKAPPKNGTIQTSTLNSKYNVPGYPANATFSKEAFNEVYAHLTHECDCFATVAQWFGLNGIISAINNRIANVSTNALIAVATLMQIPAEKSKVTTVLNALFTDMVSIVGAVPTVGNAISAVITVTWTTVKLNIGNDAANRPVAETIANIANLLNRYIEYVDTATQTQFKTLNANWGKLQEFDNAVAEGRIKASQFGMQQPGAAMLAQEPPTVPKGYISAAAAAWKYMMYKSLFESSHAVKSTMSLQSKIPNNSWNPAQGKYNFTWSLPATYINDKRNKVKGYVVMDCSTDASKGVKEDLFGPNSDLNVDPNQFFMGFNGWPEVIPLLKISYAEDNPVKEVGA